MKINICIWVTKCNANYKNCVYMDLYKTNFSLNMGSKASIEKKILTSANYNITLWKRNQMRSNSVAYENLNLCHHFDIKIERFLFNMFVLDFSTLLILVQMTGRCLSYTSLWLNAIKYNMTLSIVVKKNKFYRNILQNFMMKHIFKTIIWHPGEVW